MTMHDALLTIVLLFLLLRKLSLNNSTVSPT